MRRIVINLIAGLTLLGMLSLAGLIPRAARAEPDLVALLATYYQAYNRGDTAAAVAAFADDAVLINIGGACNAALPCTTKADIQRGIAQARNARVSYGILSSSVSGNTVNARVEQWTINVPNAGIQRVIDNVTVTFSGDKFSRLVEALDLSDAQSAQYANVARVNVLFNSTLTLLQRGDVAGVLAIFGDNPVFEGFGLCAATPCVGKDAIRRELEREVADHVSFTEAGGGFRVSGNVRTGQRELRSDSIRAAGVDRILIATTLEAPGSQIAAFRWAPVAEDAQTATFLAAQGSPEPTQVPARLPLTGEKTPPIGTLAAVGLLALGIGFLIKRSARSARHVIEFR